MFSKVALFAVAAMATFAAAAPAPGGEGINNSCNTGEVQCCNQVFNGYDARATFLKALLGINISDVTALVGVQCSPLTAIGIGGGASCSSQPVCCSDNEFEGLVVVGCSPINLNI